MPLKLCRKNVGKQKTQLTDKQLIGLKLCDLVRIQT